MFNGKIHYKWQFSIATLNYQRVQYSHPRKNAEKLETWNISGQPGSTILSFSGVAIHNHSIPHQPVFHIISNQLVSYAIIILYMYIYISRIIPFVIPSIIPTNPTNPISMDIYKINILNIYGLILFLYIYIYILNNPISRNIINIFQPHLPPPASSVGCLPASRLALSRWCPRSSSRRLGRTMGNHEKNRQIQRSIGKP